MKKVFLFALSALLFASPAVAQQVYTKDSLKTWDREKTAGGEGTLYGKYSFTRHDNTDGLAIKEIGWMTLQPGASIGMHTHKDNEDVYVIVSGEGTFTDSDGKKTVVRDGDITIARPGDSHALANTGKAPLIFLNFIGKK